MDSFASVGYRSPQIRRPDCKSVRADCFTRVTVTSRRLFPWNARGTKPNAEWLNTHANYNR